VADTHRLAWLTPRRVLALSVLVVAAGVLFVPTSQSDTSWRLTTHGTAPGQARGFYETVQRLGWPVERLETPFLAPLDTTSIYALLDVSVPVTASEAAAIFSAVRAGAGVLMLESCCSAIFDSLQIDFSEDYPDSSARADTAAWDSLGLLDRRAFNHNTLATDTMPYPFVTFLAARRQVDEAWTEPEPIAIGVPFGRGRIVIVAGSWAVSNGEFRRGERALFPIRMLEWIAPGRRPRIVFAEYHQGFGRHPSVMRGIRRALAETPAGRTLVQLLAAGAVLLLAVSIRPIPPLARTRIERRSPIEHVGALARAYAQVGATRTATRRLVRGLRRRHPIGTFRSATDEEYLSSLAARHPTLAPDIELLIAAAGEPLSADRFRDVGAAVATIDRTLST
jgi:hypothetical protein